MIKKPIPFALLVLAVLAAFARNQADAQTLVTIGASKDNTLYESATGSLSNGAGLHFFSGRTNQAPGSSIRRGLVAFDIAGNIPQNSTILSATLTLNMSQTSSGEQSISLHRVLADWGEGTSVAAGNEGGGAPATTNDATWLHRFFNTALWTTQGGDFSPTGSATQSVSIIDFYTWGSTAAMVADVQAWLDNPQSNFGWVLIGNESVMATSKRFDSKDNLAPSVRPRLNVTYQPTVSVGEDPNSPSVFALHQNYPNPFNPQTVIEFRVSSFELVTIKVFDLLGKEVATLVNEVKEPGKHIVHWDATGVASGVYFYRLQVSDFVDTKKLILLR